MRSTNVAMSEIGKLTEVWVAFLRQIRSRHSFS
jgi:hypothetical protein